ncbi:MAG: hypothetical protein MOP51_2556 [Citricoccus sp.]|nr:hypothetical protein [Citricoccus sp. WCRC_4]
MRAVHAQLTRLAEERDALAALWDERDVDAGLKSRAKTARRQLGRLRRRYRQGEVNTLQAGRQLVRIGYVNTLQGPVEWWGTLRRMRQDAVPATYRGDRPVRVTRTPEDRQRAALWKDVLAPEHGGDRTFQKAVRALAIRTGDLSEELAWTSELGTVDHQARLAIPRVNGRARELSGWVPRVPGPPDTVQPVSAGRILHLVPESRPYVSSRFTSRVHHTVLAEREAGLDPIVMTGLGFPRASVIEDVQPVEVLDGIVHYRLDTGIDYSAVAADRWLEDFAWLAYQQVRELRPAAIHVSASQHGFEGMLVALALRDKTGIPVVYELRSLQGASVGDDPAQGNPSETYRRREQVERMCMLEADAVIASTTALEDELVSRGVSQDRIAVVPNGVSPDQCRPGPRNDALATGYGIVGPTFGHVSIRDDRRERPEVLVKAASILKARGTQVQCVLAGSGDRQPELESLARLYGVLDRMVFTEPDQDGDVADHYGLIDVFVVSHTPEPVATYVEPGAPLRAMAMGRPLVVSDLPPLSEIVDAPRRGRTFTALDPIGLANAVQELLDDPPERRRLGTAGREWIARERQWTHNGSRYRSVYEDVVRRTRPQGPERTMGDAPAGEGA